MAVLTISRQLGSHGGSIAREAASSLGYRCVDKALLGRILGEYGLIDFPEEYDATRGFWDFFDRRIGSMMEMLNKAILAIAALDNVVIVGRGAFALLRGYGDVVNARVQAPFAERQRRLAEKEGITEAAKAAELVKKSDRTRALFIESVYGLAWDRADNFDIVVDTGVVPVDVAAAWLVEAVTVGHRRPGGGAPKIAGLRVDSILAEAVKAALGS
jgi:cytidylate kinase